MKRHVRGWETWISIAAGVASTAFMPKVFYADSVSEIVTVLGFIMAALIPAMALSITAVRPGNFSISRLKTLSAAIATQIQVFSVLFIYSLAACVIIICGKTLHWTLPVAHIYKSVFLHLSQIFPGSLSFLLMFLTLRSTAIVSGAMSILRLATEISLDEATLRDQKNQVEKTDSLKTYVTPREYGTKF